MGDRQTDKDTDGEKKRMEMKRSALNFPEDADEKFDEEINKFKRTMGAGKTEAL